MEAEGQNYRNYPRITDAKGIQKYARQRGLTVSETKKHGHTIKITAPDSSRSVFVPNHGNRQGLANGTRYFLLKFIETHGI